MRLSSMLKLYMRAYGIGIRELGRELGMSPATLSRIVNGENCEMRNFAKVFTWMLEPDDHGHEKVIIVRTNGR